MNASTIGMTQFTEVSKTEIHPDTIDLSELGHGEAVRFQCYFHDGLIIVAKLGLSIKWCLVHGSVDFIEVYHQKNGSSDLST